MKEQLKIALIYGLESSNPSFPIDDDSNSYSMENLSQLANMLRQYGYYVALIEATHSCIEFLQSTKYHIVLNFAESMKGSTNNVQLPALLSMLEIPYVGSDESTLTTTFNKVLTRKVLSKNNISTPKFQFFTSTDDRLNPQMSYPLLVKHNIENIAHKTQSHFIANNEEELIFSLNRMITNSSSGVLVQEAGPVRKFTATLIGNGNKVDVLPIMEKFDAFNTPVSQCPIEIEKSLEEKIQSTAIRIFNILKCRDIATISFELSDSKNLNFVDIDVLPNFLDIDSDLGIISRAAGMNRNNLVVRVLIEALSRAS